MKGEYFVVEQKPFMPPPHHKYHLKYGNMFLPPLQILDMAQYNTLMFSTLKTVDPNMNLSQVFSRSPYLLCQT